MTKKEIFMEMSNIPGVERKSGIQLVTRCVLCGDSMKNPNKKRLGIKIDSDNPTEPILYQCFNCGATGVLTPTMVKEIGSDDPELLRSIKHINNTALQSEGNVKISKYKNTKEVNVDIPVLTSRPTSIQKAKYLLDRLGTPENLEVADFQKLKIIWNISEFLHANGLRPRNNYVPLLDEYYIGFLSANNEYIICRDITNKQKMRYVKYNIFGVYDNSNSFYTIKNSLNPLTKDDIHIIASEGIFDVISLLYNVFNGDDTNRVFCATCNGQYYNTVAYYLNKGLVGRNVYVDIYRDNDNDKFMSYQKLKKQVKPYTKNFKVYYNQLSKDFGVPKSEISIDVFM